MLPAPSYSLPLSITPRTNSVNYLGGGETVVSTGKPTRSYAVRWLAREQSEADMIIDLLIESSGVGAIDGWDGKKYRTTGSFSTTRIAGALFDVEAGLIEVEDL